MLTPDTLIMAPTAWADIVEGGPGGSTVAKPPIGSPEVAEATKALAEAETALKALPEFLEPGYDEEQEIALRARVKSARTALAEYQAAAAAACADAAATPAALQTPPTPRVRTDRVTDELRAQGDARSAYELAQIREDLQGLVASEVARALANAGTLNPGIAPLASTATGAGAGKHPPAPPKFSGIQGDDKVSIKAWLLHFLEWCNLYSVPTSKWVAHAILALEGPAIETWYSRKQLLISEGKDPHCWETFKADMISKYAEVSPDLFVRNNLAALRQGIGTVQEYYDKFRTIVSQADKDPVAGAEAV